MKDLTTKLLIRYAILLVIGIVIGAIFYPTKNISIEEEQKLREEITKLQAEKRDVEESYQHRLTIESRYHRQYKEQSNQKISSLKEENLRLKSKVTEKKFKIVKPDGTIEERWFKESETDAISSTVTKIRSEFNTKVQSIENKWKEIHEKRVKKIKQEYEKKLAERSVREEELKLKKEVEINPRNFGVSLGITNEKDYFSSINYDIFGPVFLDFHIESDRQFDDKEVGVGIGLRF